jgi:two-component system phosphate regulon sensor histidine kinase PhoR
METFFATLASLFLLIAIWFGWRYFMLRRRVERIARAVRAMGDRPSGAALLDERGELENLSDAIQLQAEKFFTRVDSLGAERERLATVLEQMPDGVLIAGSEGNIEFANPAAKRLFGQGVLHSSVTKALRHHQLVHAWQQCKQGGEMQVESVELPGRQFLQLVVIPDRHIPGGSLLLVQDLTRVRRLETVRRDFVSNISHELRTPLASLKALTETLQDGALDDPEAARRFLERISIEVDALTQMAQELLDLSRIESGQIALDLRPVTPRKLLRSAAERMRLQAERAGLALTVHCPTNLPRVQADLPRVEQVLVNLIHNAVKFTRPGGKVVLLAEAGEGVVRFAVQDNGIGIPADDLPRIFERFYKADRARSGGGTGLGLSISRHLVEAHGGRIWAESREGEGSTFYFTLNT